MSEMLFAENPVSPIRESLIQFHFLGLSSLSPHPSAPEPQPERLQYPHRRLLLNSYTSPLGPPDPPLPLSLHRHPTSAPSHNFPPYDAFSCRTEAPVSSHPLPSLLHKPFRSSICPPPASFMYSHPASLHVRCPCYWPGPHGPSLDGGHSSAPPVYLPSGLSLFPKE